MRHYTIASIILLTAMFTCVGSAGATDWHVNAGESIQDVMMVPWMATQSSCMVG